MTDTSELELEAEGVRHSENVPGQWWVNDECIDCGLCYETAPGTFKLASDMAQAIVYQQPESEDEKELAEEALEECPVAAIISG